MLDEVDKNGDQVVSMAEFAQILVRMTLIDDVPVDAE
eukprot:SAG22_NODE_117_length_19289_cov_12.242574_4_plen_37_part_00